MTSNNSRRSANAGLLKVLEDGALDRQSPTNIQVDHSQPMYPENPARHGAGPRQFPHDGRSHYDFNTRSHERESDSVKQPSYTAFNDYGDVFGSSVQSTHFFTRQPQGAHFIDRPSGQPFETTLPPVRQEESDTDQSSEQYHHRHGSSLSSRFTSITTPPIFDKLYTVSAGKVESTYQVIVFGGKGVGKTTIISYFSGDDNSDIRALDQQFKMDSATVFLRHIESRKIIKLNIWEADMQDMTQTKIKKYMLCEIAIVVYDVTNKISLREANHCITTIKDNIKKPSVEFILVGNKNDVSRNNTNISKAMGLVNNIKIGHRVTSAIDGSCMDDLLEDLGKIACNQHKETNAFESRFVALEKNLATVQQQLMVSQNDLREAQETIQRLQDKKKSKCTIL